MESDKILNKLPKHILPFVEEVYKDIEGYWIYLNDKDSIEKSLL